MLKFMEIKREQLRLEQERNVLLNMMINALKDIKENIKEIKSFLELTFVKR